MNKLRVEQEMYERRARIIRAPRKAQSDKSRTSSRRNDLLKTRKPSDLKRSLAYTAVAFFVSGVAFAGLILGVAYRVGKLFDPSITFSDVVSEYFGFAAIAGLVVACPLSGFFLFSRISTWSPGTFAPWNPRGFSPNFSSFHYVDIFKKKR